MRLIVANGNYLMVWATEPTTAGRRPNYPAEFVAAARLHGNGYVQRRRSYDAKAGVIEWTSCGSW